MSWPSARSSRTWARYKLQKLRPEHIPQWHGTLLKTGLAPRTVGHAHRLLARVLGYAVENGTLARNVAVIRKPPKVEEQEIEILTPSRSPRCCAKLAGHALLSVVELALATGMRRGELLGLQWGDVDLDAGTLRVERSVEETKAGLRLKPPKTKRGRRNIRLPPRRSPCCGPQGAADGAAPCHWRRRHQARHPRLLHRRG